MPFIENSEGMKFCVECGNKLEIICPGWGFRNSSAHKFCGECGHKLDLPTESAPKELPFEGKIEKIQR